ncbi:MAG TPA: BatD family protein [Sumerlaeia bacterium]|nr:BatD family protein [Sumerlaeia bacterium]
MGIPGSAGSSSLVMVLAALAGLFSLAGSAANGEVTVEANVSQDLVSLGEGVEYSIKITARDERLDARRIRLVQRPEFVGLRERPGNPSERTETRIVNLSSSESRIFTWSLVATEEGTARIAAGKLSYGPSAYDLPPLQVRVVRDATGAVSEELGSLGVLQPQSQDRTIDQQLRGRIFALLSLSNPNPYIQEMTVATCTIYVDPALLSEVQKVGWEAPAWTDCYAEEVDIGEFRANLADLGGKRWQSVVVGRFLLAPTRSGVLEIPLNRAYCTLRIRTQRSAEERFFGFGFSPFDLGYRSLPVQLPIAPLNVNVKPLPAAGRPPSFQNAVGEFSFAGRVDRDRMSEDDFLTLTLEVGGRGYFGSVSQPNLPDLADWREAGSHAKTEPEQGMKSLQGKKIFEIVFRPERHGKLTIPAIPYAFFDPAQERYIEQTAGPFTIDVAKGKERTLLVTGASGAPQEAQKATRVIAERLAHIHTALPPLGASAVFHRSPLLLPLQIAPLLMLGMAAGLKSWKRRREFYRDALRVRAAGSRARRELKQASVALRENDGEGFHRLLAEALRGYLATKLGRSATGLTLEEIEQGCLDRGVDGRRAAALRDLLERCDRVRYLSTRGPRAAPASPDDLRGLLDDADRMLRELDKAFR